MSDWGLGKKLNSQIADVPLNHLIWLNDYKTFGENSYVFQNKDMLHELYRSPIAANDLSIYNEAFAYNQSIMSKDDFIKWYRNGYNSKYISDDVLKILLYGNFNTWTDSELTTILDSHYNNEISISDFVSVGDTRNITLSAMEATGVGESHVEQTVEFAIAGFDHDSLTTAINGHDKAAITLTQTGLLKSVGCMNSSDTNVGGWASCARRTWCNNIYYNALPNVFKSIVKPVDKLTSAGNQSATINTTSDKVFLFSEIEILGAVTYSKAGEGIQYEYYKTAANRKRSNYWWERSPQGDNATGFCRVNSGGGADSRHLASYAEGLSAGLCI